MLQPSSHVRTTQKHLFLRFSLCGLSLSFSLPLNSTRRPKMDGPNHLFPSLFASSRRRRYTCYYKGRGGRAKATRWERGDFTLSPRKTNSSFAASPLIFPLSPSHLVIPLHNLGSKLTGLLWTPQSKHKKGSSIGACFWEIGEEQKRGPPFSSECQCRGY